MSKVKRLGLRPLGLSTNIIYNNCNKSLLESRTDLKKNLISIGQCEPKVSITESMELNCKLPVKSNELNKKKNKLSSFRIKNNIKLKSSTNLNGNSKQIIKSYQSVEKKKIKKAIKTVLSKEQRIKKWLTTKESVDDPDYWRLYSECLSKELTETLDHLDELELENELLIAEFNQISKLAENSCKLNILIKKTDLTKLLTTEGKDDS